MAFRAHSLPEKQEHQEAKQQHITEVKLDREASSRTNHLSEQACKNPSTDGYNQLLKITMDGMDQSKFKVPRNIASNAEWADSWRPMLHFVGAIHHEHGEYYFVMPTDCPKDANMECTVVARLLDLIYEEYYRDCPHALPRMLAIATDNTAREAVNQTFSQFMGFLTASGVFEDVTNERLQVSHTHNEMDQRFSSTGSILARAPVLEDPEEFCDWIREHVTPPRGRKLHVEVLNTTFDFQSWLSILNVQIKGPTPTVLQPEFNHVLHFLHRDLVARAWPNILSIECEHDQFAEWQQEHGDAILVTKHILHSSAASQNPILAFPVELCKLLDKLDLKVSNDFV